MNNKLTDQILSLTKSLTGEEQIAFEKESKQNSFYIQLFRIFRKFSSKSGNSINEEIEREASGITGEFNDLKENLLKKLIEFISKIEREKNKVYFEIKNNIESVTALRNRGLYVIANEVTIKTYKKLKKIKADGTNYHLFLQYLNQVLETQRNRYDKDTKSLPVEFENKEAIEWLNRITQTAAGYLAPSQEPVSDDFSSNLFFHLLNEHLLLKKDYRELDKILTYSGDYHLDTLLGLHRNKNSDDDTLVTFRILVDLFRLQIAIRLNEPQEIGFVLDSIANHSFHFKEKNYETFIFLMLQIFDFRMNMALDTKQFSIFEKADSWLDITKRDLKLFTAKEIEGVSLRIEINKGLVYLLSEEYERSYKQFASIPIHENISLEHKYYIKLFELISYRLHHQGFQYKVFEKGLGYLATVKYNGSNYSKQFIRLLNENIDGKHLLKQGKEFLTKHSPTTTYDKVLQYWLIQIQPKK